MKRLSIPVSVALAALVAHQGAAQEVMTVEELERRLADEMAIGTDGVRSIEDLGVRVVPAPAEPMITVVPAQPLRAPAPAPVEPAPAPAQGPITVQTLNDTAPGDPVTGDEFEQVLQGLTEDLGQEGTDTVATAIDPVDPQPQAADGGNAADGPALTAAAIEGATYTGGPLPDGPSPLTVKVQVLLDRADISPGIIDGWKGGMSTSAIQAFEAREGLPVDGVMDMAVWDALGGDVAGPVTRTYVVTPEDHARIGATLPEDYSEIARMDWIHYTSVTEKLAEDFHMDEDFLRTLNPGSDFAPGQEIVVVDPQEYAVGAVARIEIDKTARRLLAMDDAGRVIANYPVAVGSTQPPSPSGTVGVEAVAYEPTYSYNPQLNFQQGDNDEFLTLPPGPNGPVGLVWIDLSEPTYGIHGTPEPASLFSAHSNGCVRMSNWDALELADMVSTETVVTFIE